MCTDDSVSPMDRREKLYAGHFTAIQIEITGVNSGDGNRAAYEYSSGGVQSIWQSRHNLSSWIQTVASRITSAIRSNRTLTDPAGSAKIYAGVATLTRAFVRVRWALIVYPGAMLALGILHFVATLWQTIRNNVHPWKDNSIVPLLLTLEMSDGQVGSMDDSGRVPDKILDQKTVLSCDEGRGWVLSANDP